jgi:glycosyltransferase A (GT-A) superfamily protein (DUF2064 family)
VSAAGLDPKATGPAPPAIGLDPTATGPLAPPATGLAPPATGLDPTATATPSPTAAGSDATLIVIAKAPVPGRSKTRLTPPCTPEQAAALAEAALTDTLHAVLATPAARRILVLEGEPGPWLPVGFEVLPQRGDGLDERLAAGFFDAVGPVDAPPTADGGTSPESSTDERSGVRAPAGGRGPALLVGMDTPQVTPADLAAAWEALVAPGTDAVLGLAPDGGYWAIGLRVQDPALFVGVPMSTESTGREQEARLRAHGLNVALLPELRDVDRMDDARAVAALAPDSRFARALEAIA